MLKTYKNQCYICGFNEHFVIDCKNNNNNNNKPKFELDTKCNCTSSYFLPHRKKVNVLYKIQLNMLWKFLMMKMTILMNLK